MGNNLRRIVGLLHLLLATACIEPREPTAFQHLVNNGMEDQGRFLLGTMLDAMVAANSDEHFSVSTTGVNAANQPVVVTLSNAAVLTAAQPLENLVLTGGPAQLPTKLRIHLVEQPPAPRPTITKFRLEVLVDGTWTAGPCGAGLAIPLAGVFTRTGLHVATPGRITFACEDEGVAGKCVNWGYPPGAAGTGLIWDTHQACTRMARADTCANGRPHTRNSTRIWFYDTVAGNAIPDAIDELVVDPIEAWPPAPDRYFFESIWRAGTRPAACLSKLRWQALMPGALCGGLLPDPRIPSDDGVVDTCEATSIADAIDRGGALLFNKTQYSDLALGLWSAELPSGRDYTTTVRGFVGGGDVPTVHPFWEHVDGAYQPLRIDGFLMRVPPVDVDPQDYAPVATFTNGRGDRVLARTNDPEFGAGSGYVVEYDEGYVLKAPREGASAPLRLYLDPRTGDRVTTTLEPPTAAHQFVKVVGYVTAPETPW